MIFGLRYDWGLHFIVGFAARVAISSLVFLCLLYMNWPIHWAMGVAFIGSEIITTLVAKLKENYDRRYPLKHHEDGWDAYWTQAGSTAGGVVALALFFAFYFFRA